LQTPEVHRLLACCIPHDGIRIRIARLSDAKQNATAPAPSPSSASSRFLAADRNGAELAGRAIEGRADSELCRASPGGGCVGHCQGIKMPRPSCDERVARRLWPVAFASGALRCDIDFLGVPCPPSGQAGSGEAKSRPSFGQTGGGYLPAERQISRPVCLHTAVSRPKAPPGRCTSPGRDLQAEQAKRHWIYPNSKLTILLHIVALPGSNYVAAMAGSGSHAETCDPSWIMCLGDWIKNVGVPRAFTGSMPVS